ncbi:sugar phosphate permease [Ereboglobus sp. PH5-10]|uniref:MFS transporter n=1 Tax=Ereboglobus sp. PH5-10 TaxID=2940629 RepID=UPI002406F5F7|nr:MFS transporter [Ereboglobus sp. PH5-10]MDF9827308.1 sugar phosphate permease [Ereboglobus sp. PH5-10]
MTPEQAKRFKYWQTRTIIGTMVGYALYYFVRKNFSLAMPGLEADMGITKVQLGFFLTLHGVIYGCSRFVNGFIADRVSGRKFMTLGLVLCSLANYAFGFSDTFARWTTGMSNGAQFLSVTVVFMGVIWVMNGFVQGMGVPPVNRLLTHWIPARELATKMSVWNTSHSIGAGLVVILCGYLMTHFGVGAWRLCFFVPATISLCGAVWLWFTLRDTPSSLGLPELTNTATAGKVEKTDTKSPAYRAFVRKQVFGNRIIWTIAFVNFLVYIVRFTILDWGPTLLKETKGVSLASAGWMVALFEIAGIVGMLVAGWATDRFLKSRAHRTCVFCMIGAAVSMLLFWKIPADAHPIATFVALCMAGFFIYGPQALLGIATSNHATKKASATGNGLVGLFGYASTVISGLGIGFMAKNYGWDHTFVALLGVAIFTILVLLTIWNIKADSYEEAEKLEAKIAAKYKDGNPLTN